MALVFHVFVDCPRVACTQLPSSSSTDCIRNTGKQTTTNARMPYNDAARINLAKPIMITFPSDAIPLIPWSSTYPKRVCGPRPDTEMVFPFLAAAVLSNNMYLSGFVIKLPARVVLYFTPVRNAREWRKIRLYLRVPEGLIRGVRCGYGYCFFIYYFLFIFFFFFSPQLSRLVSVLQSSRITALVYLCSNDNHAKQMLRLCQYQRSSRLITLCRMYCMIQLNTGSLLVEWMW